MNGFLGTRNTIAVVPDWKDAGVDSKTLFREDIQRPHRPGGNRKARGPIAGDGVSSDLLKDLSRSHEVLTELGRRLLVDQAVPIAVRCNLVTATLNLADEVRLVFGDPAEDKEGSLDRGLVEEIQDAS